MPLIHLEDYLEFLFGTMNAQGMPCHGPSQIKLATYDRSPVTTMGNFCSRARTQSLETCLTDKQVPLARKLVDKYRRQMATFGIEVLSVDELPLRHGLRTIDRTKLLSYVPEANEMLLRFPYDPRKITAFHDYKNNSGGKINWSQKDRQWTMDLTEGNLAHVIDVFKDENDLQVDPALEVHVRDILSASVDSLPTFAIENEKMVLRNCHESITTHLVSRGWNEANVSRLPLWVSYCAKMGLRIDPTVINQLTQQYGSDVVDTLINLKVVMPSNNQHDGPWLSHLREVYSVLQGVDWLLSLSWWTDKTDWSEFANAKRLPRNASASYSRQHSREAVDMVQNLSNTVVVSDSVIGSNPLRDYIEQHALKVIYISDIGGPR